MAYWYARLSFLILLTAPLPVRRDPDVPVGVALMDQNPVLVEGYDAELSCRFHGTPRAVAYYKDVVGSGLLITWYDHSGPGHDSGKYNITDAYSLVIHEVTAIDAGRYYCWVLDYRGIIISNGTDAMVQTAPRAPFPTIDQCPTSNESPCTLYVNHSDDAVNLTCRAEDASRGLVSLLWSHSGSPEGLQQQNRIFPHQDGRTETVEATIEVQNSSDPYVCTAIVHAPRFENQTASVTVWVPIAATTTTTTTTTTTSTTAVLPPTSPNVGRQTLLAVLCSLLIAVTIIIIIVVYVKRETLKSLKYPLYRGPHSTVAENPEIEGEPLSYIELWWLCKTVPDLHALTAVTRKLRRQADETLGYTDFEYVHVPSRRELYDALCGWKEEVEVEGEELRQRHRIGEALREQKMNKQVTTLEEFRTSNEEITDDDLEHICWSVRELPKRVNPVLKALGFKKQRSTDNDAPAWPIPPRQQERRAAVEEDMQSLLKWRVVARGANKMYTDENIGSSKRVVLAGTHDGGEVSFPLTGLNERADGEGLNGRRAGSVNERVVMCRALEQANKRDSRYREVAKNFSLHALNDASSKRNPTEEEIRSLAIAISSRHCLKLNEKVELSPGKCKALAKENLDVLFRSHSMLEDWLKEQMCSSYEIRCRLRAAAERAGREDIADMVIRKESMIDPSEPAQISINRECSTDKTDQPVSYITLEELRWIWRIAGKKAVQTVCSHYEIAPEAESTGHGEEAGDDLLKRLQAKLNNEYVEKKQKGKGKQSEKMDPRGVVRQILKEVHPSYASLMPKVVEQRFISDVEITELALRIALRDIYDFAEALGISMGRLTNYRLSFQQGNKGKGTFAIVFKLVEQLAKKNMINTRRDLRQLLRDLGYRQEARMIFFDHSVGIRDMIAVAKSEDTSALLRELGVSVSGSNPDVQANPDAKSKPDLQTTVDALRGWRGAIHPPSFNHRTALAEALYRMDKKPLALKILSGKHREGAMTSELADQLARNIPADDDHTSRLCEALLLKETKDRKFPSNPKDAIMTWAMDGKRHSWKKVDEGMKCLDYSNRLFRAGFFEVAYEINAGVTQQQGGNKGRPTNKPSNDSHDIPQSSHENDEMESPRDEDDEEIVTSPSEDAGIQNETALPVTIQVSTEHDVQAKLPQNQPAPEEYHGRAKRTFRV